MKQSVETSELLKYRVLKCVPERTKQIIQVYLYIINFNNTFLLIYFCLGNKR